MQKYKVECMVGSYGKGPTKEFEASSDSEAFEIGWKFAKQQWKCIAFSVSKKVGRRKVYVGPEESKKAA